MDDFNSLFGVLQDQANLNNSWSAEQAQKQMDFQERMSNTAHQREVADLKAAGLNPVLSARLGGASTPSGSSATADTSIVSSMVQLMDKMLDVQGTSAAAAYNASGGASRTTGYDAGSPLTGKEAAGLARLTEEGSGMSADAANALNKIGYSVGSAVADTLGLPEDSKVRAYLTGNWSMQDTINAAKDLYGKAKNQVKTGIQFYKDLGNPNVPAKSSAHASVKNAVSTVKNVVSNAASKAKSFAKWLFTGKK